MLHFGRVHIWRFFGFYCAKNEKKHKQQAVCVTGQNVAHMFVIHWTYAVDIIASKWIFFFIYIVFTI